MTSLFFLVAWEKGENNDTRSHRTTPIVMNKEKMEGWLKNENKVCKIVLIRNARKRAREKDTFYRQKKAERCCGRREKNACTLANLFPKVVKLTTKYRSLKGSCLVFLFPWLRRRHVRRCRYLTAEREKKPREIIFFVTRVSDTLKDRLSNGVLI